jgi:hypothetical protein
MADLVRRLIGGHRPFCDLSEGMDALDILDPGLPIEERPRWYLPVTRLLVAAAIVCSAASVIAALLEVL